MGEPFKTYTIDQTSKRRLVRDVEQLLRSRQLTTGSMKAHTPVELNIVNDPAVADKDNDHSLLPSGRWSTRGFQRGFGSSLHGAMRGATYEVWASEALLEMCRRR